MGLFSKKAQESKCSCCSGNCSNGETVKPEAKTVGDSSIKVLGSGCAKCKQLEANTKEALTQLGMDIAIEHVTDFAQIAAYGVMSTPALVMNGKVISFGKVLKTEEVIEILKKVQ